jgi:hypothetical protein
VSESPQAALVKTATATKPMQHKKLFMISPRVGQAF